VIDQHGLFCELYTDRGSHYFHTPKAGEPVSKSVQTPVGRALAQLGIRHIAASSPEARGLLSMSKGRARLRTLQDRLPKALAGITTIAAANRWLDETYWPAHNAAFAVTPAEAGSAFVADRTGRVRDILCIQEEAPRRQRQHRQVAWPEPADPAEPASAGQLRPRGKAAR